MSLRALFLILVFVVLAIFTVLNWSAFMSPTTLSLLFASVQAPLGLIMLVVTALLAALFLDVSRLRPDHGQSPMRGRSARELAAQRDLADQAEASRFTELRGFLDGRLQQIETAVLGGAVAHGDPGRPPRERPACQRSSARRTRWPPISANWRTAWKGERAPARESQRPEARRILDPFPRRCRRCRNAGWRPALSIRCARGSTRTEAPGAIDSFPGETRASTCTTVRS